MKLLFSVVLVVLVSVPAAAQSGFVLTSPDGSSPVPAGQPITVTWTGGAPTDNVNVVLISEEPFQVYTGFGIAPNSGSRVVTIPLNVGLNGTCDRRFMFYIEDAPRTMWTYGDTFTVVCRTAVAIDIKPGSFPNSINLGSGGATPVAILGSSMFDVTRIDVGTLTLGTAGVKTVGKTSKYMCSLGDVSGDFTAGPEGAPDGILDLVCHFVTVNIVPEAGGTTASLKGDLLGGGAFEGADSVEIVP